MTPRAKALANIRALLASLESKDPSAPPHRQQTGRAAPDPEVDREAMVAAAIERYAPLVGELRQANPSGKRRTDGLCPTCRERPRREGKNYCQVCMAEYKRQWVKRRQRAA